MSRKSKKQPYRNALLKLKKERSSLDSLYKENQRLNASLLYKHQEAQDLLKTSADKRASAERLFEEARHEIRTANPYHPTLFEESEICCTSVQEALQYRISAPRVGWDDYTKEGIVKITCHDQLGGISSVAYGVSGGMLRAPQGLRYHDGFINDLSTKIAIELITLAEKQMKEW